VGSGEPSEASARGAVLVTGASSGIGRATALALDSLGFEVFAGVRKDSDAESLRLEGSDRLEPLMLDVADEASVDAAASAVESGPARAGSRGWSTTPGWRSGLRSR
jgi:NAD(P)-dependent dehydrogenase (short-subunit alcohol dehydrogenase family)